MCIHTRAHTLFLTILFHFSSLCLFSTFPTSLALCLEPARRSGVGGGVLTWHWVCSARPPVAAGGPFGFLWGQGLLIVKCTPPANMLIWNTDPELTSEEGEAGVRGHFTTAFSAIHSSLPSGSLFIFFSLLLPSRFPSLLTPWCIHKHTQTQGKDPGQRPKKTSVHTRIMWGFTRTKLRNHSEIPRGLNDIHLSQTFFLLNKSLSTLWLEFLIWAGQPYVSPDYKLVLEALQMSNISFFPLLSLKLINVATNENIFWPCYRVLCNMQSGSLLRFFFFQILSSVIHH